jgi:hypothetical protein
MDATAFVAQLGERKTEDLKVRGSIPRGGIFLLLLQYCIYY